jgi:hypothetical protein
MDEFEDDDFVVRHPATLACEADAVSRRRSAIANVVSRVYRAANDAVRADMLMQLLRPLGMLGLVGVASGAFARLVRRDGLVPATISTEDLLRFSGEPIHELTLFVHEVNPEALQPLFEQLAQNGMGMAALGAAALVLLHRSAQVRPVLPKAGPSVETVAGLASDVAAPAAPDSPQTRSSASTSRQSGG